MKLPRLGPSNGDWLGAIVGSFPLCADVFKNLEAHEKCRIWIFFTLTALITMTIHEYGCRKIAFSCFLESLSHVWYLLL